MGGDCSCSCGTDCFGSGDVGCSATHFDRIDSGMTDSGIDFGTTGCFDSIGMTDCATADYSGTCNVIGVDCFGSCSGMTDCGITGCSGSTGMIGCNTDSDTTGCCEIAGSGMVDSSMVSNGTIGSGTADCSRIGCCGKTGRVGIDTVGCSRIGMIDTGCGGSSDSCEGCSDIFNSRTSRMDRNRSQNRLIKLTTIC